MLKNYFIVAIRNFQRNKVFSLINVIGLSIGISAALVIFLIVHYDFSFDKFEPDGHRIYRVVTDMKMAGDLFPFSGVPSPLPEAVNNEVTGIEATASFHEFNGSKVSIPKANAEKPVVFKRQTGIIFTNENYFKLLPFQWLAGTAQTALRDPFKVVLSEQRASAYFPGVAIEDMIGRNVRYDDSTVATVSGIVKEPTVNTDFTYKEFISSSTIPAAGLKNNYSWDSWGSVNSSSQLMVKIANGSSPMAIESQLKKLVKKYRPEANKDDKNTVVFRMQPLADIHFNSVYQGFGNRTAHKPTLYGLLIVAAFLLLLGCINFINLATAQSSHRAKEIGIRKTMGSSGAQLRLQFLSETFLITIMATVLSILIVPLLLKIFADFIPKNLQIDALQQPFVLLFLTGLVMGVTFFAGFYPAIFLSGFNPTRVLKNQVYAGSSGSGKAWLRKGFTVAQFFIAQIFIMATLVTGRQIHYVLNADLGFRKDAIVSVPLPYNWSGKPDNKKSVLLNEVKSIPGIQMMSMNNGMPAAEAWASSTMKYTDGKKEIITDVEQKSGDSNYIKLFNIKLLAGKNVLASDTTREFLINETYLHILGFRKPQDVLQKRINGSIVVGVIADFHQRSLHAPIKPLVFSASNNESYNLGIALKAQDAGGLLWKTTLGRIEKAFKQIYPEEDFNYEFVDDGIARFYENEQHLSRLLKWATGLAIFISCLGLLGLVIFTTNSRTKEIGVRKVLGASVSQIVSILSKDFIALVLAAFLIATPLAWWAMNKWLQNFAYRITISWWLFVAGGAIMMLIAVLTMSIQTFRAANENPAKSLKTE